MATYQEEIWPVAQPVKVSEDAEPEWALWFVLSDITGSPDEPADASTASKFKSKLKKAIPSSDGDLLVVPIKMSNSDYENHFATDEKTGEYSYDVSEPAGGRVAWLKKRLDEQNPKERKIREIRGSATSGSATGLTGAAGAGAIGLGVPGGGGA